MNGIRRDTEAVIWIVGEHDVSTRDALSSEFDRFLAAGSEDVVADLSGVTFMSAAAVGVLIDARRQALLQGRGFTVRAPSHSAARVLDLCSLSNLCENASVVREGVERDRGLCDGGERARAHESIYGGSLATWVNVPVAARSDVPSNDFDDTAYTSEDRHDAPEVDVLQKQAGGSIPVAEGSTSAGSRER